MTYEELEEKFKVLKREKANLKRENTKLKNEIKEIKRKMKMGGRPKKLDKDQVKKIQADERTYKTIAKEYKIAVGTISSIKNGKYILKEKDL